MLTCFKRILKSGWTNFKRNAGLSLATIFIMVLTISLLSSLFILKESSDFLITSLREKVDMAVYFTEDSKETEILEVKDTLALLPEVKEVAYISREEALEKFTQRHAEEQVIMESLQEVGVNPLLASLSVKAWEAAQYQGIVDFLDNSAFEGIIAKVDYSQKKPAIERFSYITGTINTCLLNCK